MTPRQANVLTVLVLLVVLAAAAWCGAGDAPHEWTNDNYR